MNGRSPNVYAPQLEAYRTAQNSSAPGKGIEATVLTQSTLLPSDFGKSREIPGRAMYASQLDVYRAVKNSTASGREIEAGALTRCALMLSDCQKNWDAPGREEKLAEALRVNQQVWSIFQSELSGKDNPLPKPLRENILSLSLFIDKRILQVMAYPAPEKLQILIDINLNLAAGLRSKPVE
jgi:flagellar biosynthesis activator protein FlaF